MLRQTITTRDNMKVESYNAWATPFYYTDLKEFVPEYNKSLKDYAYNLKKNDPVGRSNSNENGYQSKLLDPNDKQFRPLSDKIFELCKNMNIRSRKKFTRRVSFN